MRKVPNIKCNEVDVAAPAAASGERNIMDVLMRRTTPLKPIEEKDMKCKLHNSLLVDIQSDCGGQLIRGHYSQEDGTKVLKQFSNVIWYLDGRASTINKAASTGGTSNIPRIPQR